jgi:hypothetical protein
MGKMKVIGKEADTIRTTFTNQKPKNRLFAKTGGEAFQINDATSPT